MGSAPYSLRIDDDLRRALEEEARIEDRPPSQLAVRAIRAMLDAKAAKRAAIEAALKEADDGKVISAENIATWIDTWDTDTEQPAPKPDASADME